jgi:predicted ATPase
VLVALVAAQPGQMVLVEQPELHLHPQAQLAMGRVIADAAQRGVLVVVETHSQLILRAIQTVVAQKKIAPESVGLHWFSRDEESGESKVVQADLQPDGTFGDWPVDFPDIFAMADKDFVDAVFANHP